MAEANPSSTAQLDEPRQLTGDSIADPGPLGLAAFASTTFVLSCFNANLVDASLSAVVLPLALFYGGLGQLLAGMWEFRKGNTFGATAFSSFGAFWLSFAGYVRSIAPHLPPADAHQATGLFLLAWAIFTVYMTVAALKTSGAVLGVFVFLSLTFILLAVGEFAQSTGITKVGGWFGLVTAVLAWYASFAAVTNATWRRPALPTWPRG
ncbi:acetate uptake transporter [Streptantibioticus ferralitis]|uniref:Acetate uptake transporter n=1 Tax=Streptantibioticus ferralitis TaxID=236510 RepID=A0ABT5YT49_9ACTN|nr:acetate uptake transporter [Streptantibioticus ferralitis]MDF2254781.1 acetate uptake transporter [Streptantibioticus ferralitis]